MLPDRQGRRWGMRSPPCRRHIPHSAQSALGTMLRRMERRGACVTIGCAAQRPGEGRRCPGTAMGLEQLIEAGLVSVVAGLFGSLLGLGGALFITPLLTGPLGVPIHRAV